MTSSGRKSSTDAEKSHRASSGTSCRQTACTQSERCTALTQTNCTHSEAELCTQRIELPNCTHGHTHSEAQLHTRRDNTRSARMLPPKGTVMQLMPDETTSD
eukprot:6484629-Amphidinium_carterae.2